MQSGTIDPSNSPKLTMATMPTPAKALATCVIVVLAIGMLGALGQIVVHDIIPDLLLTIRKEQPGITVRRPSCRHEPQRPNPRPEPTGATCLPTCQPSKQNRPNRFTSRSNLSGP